MANYGPVKHCELTRDKSNFIQQQPSWAQFIDQCYDLDIAKEDSTVAIFFLIDNTQ